MSMTTEPTTGSNTEALSKAGVSIWLDDLSRERIVTKNLQQLIDEKNVVGVTTNPTIFASALAKGETYDEQVRELKAKGADTAQAIFEITTKDVSDALEPILPVTSRLRRTELDDRIDLPPAGSVPVVRVRRTLRARASHMRFWRFD